MNLTKLAFSDPLSSPRRRVVSRFSLWVVVAFFALSVVLFNFSFKAPFLNSVFQGFNSLSSHNISWPFSLPKSNFTSFSSSNSNISSNGAEIAKELQHPLVLDQTIDANDGNFTKINGEDLVRGLKNGSFSGEIGSVQDISRVPIGSQIDKNGSFFGSGAVGTVLGKIEKGNLTEIMVNESSIAEVDVSRSEEMKKNAGVINSNEKSNSTSNGEKNLSAEGSKEGNATSNGDTLTEGKNNTISSSDSQDVKAKNSLSSECDIFHGRWVRDDTKPYYPPGSCPYIDRDFDCYLNGRPEAGYVKWRWQPYGCDIPSLNATDFLERLRGQKLVFVGDSLNRNMWESLICILRHSVRNKKRVYEISGRTEFKKKGFYAFRFEDYNCSVDFVGSPFLVKELYHNGKNGSFETLRLDLMDQTTSMYHDADVIIFNTGHWWTHEKTSKGEDYYQEGDYVYPKLGVLEAYKKALTTWARWVDKNIDLDRTQVIFRGYSLTHFRGGPWNSGGQCHNETEPITNDAYLAEYPSKMKAFEHVLQQMKTPVIYLNISRLTDYRKDAHPGIYRKQYKPEQQLPNDHIEDCSHWCLPGVPDTWNELLYAALLRSQRGSWRN